MKEKFKPVQFYLQDEISVLGDNTREQYVDLMMLNCAQNNHEQNGYTSLDWPFNINHDIDLQLKIVLSPAFDVERWYILPKQRHQNISYYLALCEEHPCL